MPLLGSPLPDSTAARVLLARVNLVTDDPRPGTWFFLNGDPAVCCPRCGRTSRLGPQLSVERTYDLARGLVKGDVSPAVACPFTAPTATEPGCDARYQARLLNWAPGNP